MVALGGVVLLSYTPVPKSGWLAGLLRVVSQARGASLDELRIWWHPVLFGRATPSRLPCRDTVRAAFTLSGVVLSFVPVSGAEA